jgi:hypothetical protein
MSCYRRLTDPHDRRVALPVINVLIHIEDVEAARAPTAG